MKISYTAISNCQVYTVVLTGTITTSSSPSVHSASDSFLVGCYSCATTTETITITGTAPATQSYLIAAATGSVTFSVFTENSAYCAPSDFTYSINVTAPSGVTNTSWITLSTRTISWATSLFANVGAYTIKITAKLPNPSATSNFVTFTLNVGATCATGHDQPTLVVSTPTADQTLVLGTAGSVTAAAFAISPAVTYC
jgi:hypothetical protein